MKINSGIPPAGSLPSGISATKIADGSVSNAEFQALDGGITYSEISDFSAGVKATEVIALEIAASDETTNISIGTAKVTFRIPFAFTLTNVRASLNTVQPSGSIFTVDINENGTTILSTKLTIDNTEKSSVTATTPVVISDSSLADDSEITVDVDQIGDSGAKGLKIILIGQRT